MTDEQKQQTTDTEDASAAAPEAEADVGAPAGDGAESGEAWRDVISQLDALGEAMGRWAHAAVNDPANRERAHEIKEHMNKMVDKVNGAIDDATATDVGQSFREAASKTGEAFKVTGAKISEEVAPRVASAFKSAAEKLHQAAENMERPAASADQGAAEPAAEPDADTVEPDGGASSA